MLPAGSNNFQVQSEERNDTGPDDPQRNGGSDPFGARLRRQLGLKPLQRHVAESVLARGGKLKLVGSDAVIDNAEDLPTSGSLHIEEINLAGARRFRARKSNSSKTHQDTQTAAVAEVRCSRSSIQTSFATRSRTVRSDERRRKVPDAVPQPDYSDAGRTIFWPELRAASSLQARRAWLFSW